MKIRSIATLTSCFEKTEKNTLTDFYNTYKDRLFKVNVKHIKKSIIPRPVSGHKGTFGHALIIAGEKSTPGAAVLSSRAALKTGCGLLTAFIPKEALIPLLVQLPEAMVVCRNENDIRDIDLSKFDAIAFGPGAGTGEESAFILNYLLNNFKGRLVIDADGLTILSNNRSWFSLLHNNIILTPHPSEFDRLTKAHDSMRERIQTQIALEEKYKISILLKGHRTTNVTGNKIYFNSTGNNGMATAGSGDVLTGIITSLCAQGYACADAAIVGAYLHGYAGDIAAGVNSMHSMIASDIINGIGAFFKKFET